MGRNESMTDKIKQIITRWKQESENPRNDGYTQAGYRGYIEEIRDHCAQALGDPPPAQSSGNDANKWWKKTN